MSQPIRNRIHLIYGCVLAALIAALGIGLILSCLGIYNSGPRAYSYDSIGDAFWRIAALVFVCVGGIVGGIVMNLVIPLDRQRPKAMRDDATSLAKLKARLPELNSDDANRECRLRLIYRIATAILCAGLIVYPAIYFARPFLPAYKEQFFTVDNLNGDIIRSVIIVMVPAIICLGLCFTCTILIRKSLQRETAIYKQALLKNQGQSPVAKRASTTPVWVWVLRGSLLMVGVLFVILGIFNSGMNDVFTKAVAICTECIGLG